MILPTADSRESASVIHAFMEEWSIICFVVVVACDVILHLFGEKSGTIWTIGWEKKSRLILWGKHALTLRFPAYSGTLGLKSLLKLLSLISFALAIGLELIGYPYGKLNDELANKEVASLQAQASEALRKASVAATQTIGLRKQVEEERLKRVEIEARVAWRRLTKQQQCAIGSRLKRFSGEPSGVYFINGDTEGGTFASDIVWALRIAGWKVREPSAYFFINGPMPPPPTGVVVGNSGNKLSVRASNALMRELTNLGFDCEKEPQITQPNAWVSIKINRRPEGPQGEANLRRRDKIR